MSGSGYEPDKLIEGRNPVLEALRAGRSINKILISKGGKEGSIRQVTALAKEKGVVVQEVSRVKLDNMSSTHAHQGVIAISSVRDYIELDELLETAAAAASAAASASTSAATSAGHPLLLVLDGVEDPYNLGSIIRTADAVGANGVIIPKHRAAGLTGAVAKASAGAIEYVPVARVTNIAMTLDLLKQKGYWIAGADSVSGDMLFNADMKGPLAVVIGGEGTGIGRLVRQKCDFIVNIPMKGHISSLNTSAAAAVVLYEVLRQRMNTGKG